MSDGSLTLADGRRLTYRVDGPDDGPPVVLLHGTPGSRLDGDPLGRTFGTRLVRFDRPGFGGSDRRADRTLLGWPDDLAALADHLGIERFALIGVSGGGPHALAAAHRVGDRLTRVGVVCGISPLDGDDWADGLGEQQAMLHRLVRDDPAAVTALFDATGAVLASDSDAVVEQFVASLPDVDREVMTDPAVRAMAMAGLREALRPGGAGTVDELAMLHRPWGFALESIEPEVLLWQGTADVNVPPFHAVRMAEAIPRSTLTVIDGEGHLSLPMRHFGDVFAAVVG